MTVRREGPGDLLRVFQGRGLFVSGIEELREAQRYVLLNYDNWEMSPADIATYDMMSADLHRIVGITPESAPAAWFLANLLRAAEPDEADEILLVLGKMAREGMKR